MPKNIVLCLDGTGDQFGNANSNVIKLYYTLIQDEQTQIAYYHPGLGTMGAPSALTRLSQWWTRIKGLAFGYGLTANIGDAYAYLMENYEPGDNIYIFGFSRGAYTARALAAVLHLYGLLRPGNEALVPYITLLFRAQSAEIFSLAARFGATFSRPCKARFLGLWDTVSSVGWIYNPVKLPYTAMNPAVSIVRHAVSIDERRAMFRQNLWSNPTAGQDVQQVWFAGVHSDVGGGYAESQSGLSKIALKWMLDEAGAAGLRVDAAKRDRVLGVTDPKFSRPDPTAVMHQSLRGFWWLLEFWPKRYWSATSDPPRYKWRWPLGSPRFIPEGSRIHESVITRINSNILPRYHPRNLPLSISVKEGQYYEAYDILKQVKPGTSYSFEQLRQLVKGMTDAQLALLIADMASKDLVKQYVEVEMRDGSKRRFDSVFEVPSDLRKDVPQSDAAIRYQFDSKESAIVGSLPEGEK